MEKENESPIGIKGIVQTIYCPGASFRSTPIPALVEVRQFYDQHVAGERYVTCPRLCLYEHPAMSGVIARCFEGKTFEGHSERQFRKTKPCPYFRPIDDREEDLEKCIYDLRREKREKKRWKLWGKREPLIKEQRLYLYEKSLGEILFKAVFPNYYAILLEEKLTT